MNLSNLQEVVIKIEKIPAHKFIGIWDTDAGNYGEFWSNGKHDCDEVCGTLRRSSLKRSVFEPRRHRINDFHLPPIRARVNSMAH